VFTPFSFAFWHFPIDSGELKYFPILAVEKLEHFEQKGKYAVFCPMGQASFAEMSELISCAVFLCRQKKIKRLLIDSTKLTGFPQREARTFHNGRNFYHDGKITTAASSVAAPNYLDFRQIHRIVCSA